MTRSSVKLSVLFMIFFATAFINGLPFFGSQHSEVVAVKTALKDKIMELEYTVSSLERSIRATNEFQKSLQALQALLARAIHKVHETTHQDCSSIQCPKDYLSRRLYEQSSTCACVSTNVVADLLVGFQGAKMSGKSNDFRIGRRNIVRAEADEKNNFTYIPPPKTDVTPQLLSESLAVQPQDTATVGSIMPFFQEDVISFGCQLNGFIASTMTLNASTELPCDGIGAQSQPDLELRPKDIDNGTTQAYVPDCSIIAVNMYDPNVITYWVQNRGGAIYSLTGSNKIVDINQLNSTASTSLVLRAIPAGSQKRDAAMHDCDMAGQAIADRALEKRAVLPPDWHTASMSPEACAAIKCNNNGGNPAMFNPFTKTCGCREPDYVQFDNSG